MENVLLNLAADIDARVRRQIFGQERSKAFAFAAYADAEDSGEGEIFERALHHVREPRLRRMLERHRDDERRHAHILRERRDQLGLPVLPVPEHLALVDRLSDAAGGVLDKPMQSDDELADAWALLYVIEERALDEFWRSARAIAAAGDHESSALFLSIRKDEERHLRYCTAVGERYDREGFAARIDRMRAIERVAYGAAARDWTWHQIETGYVRLPPGLDWTVRFMMTITGWMGAPALPPMVDAVTPAGEPPLSHLPALRGTSATA